MISWLYPCEARSQSSVAFLAVDLKNSRTADDKLRRYLETNAGVSLVSEGPLEYRAVVDRMVRWNPDKGPYIARVTPYALVAAELLGADVDVLATYVSRSTHGTTYRSFFVVNRNEFRFAPEIENVARYLRQRPKPARYVYHSDFSTSSFFLPALYFRANSIFDMPDSNEQSTAIHAERFGSGSADLIKAVATGRAEIAAVPSDTKALFERADSLGIKYGSKVLFIPLPSVIPNDLLVASLLDSGTSRRVHRAIAAMGSNAIDDADFMTWKDLGDAQDAREALGNLRWVARERLTPSASVSVQPADSKGNSISESYLRAAQQAIRLSGPEFVNFDRDFHARPDYVWTIEPVHANAVLVTSRIVGSDASDQVFEVSFRDNEDLTGRLGEILHSRLDRIRYIWPYKVDPPTVIRDLDFNYSTDPAVRVRKIRWIDPRRNSFTEYGEFDARIVRSDFHKFELSPNFTTGVDESGFGFNPLSNISYRVVLARSVHEKPVFKYLTVLLLGLLILAAIFASLQLRRVLRDGVPATESAS